MIFTFYAINAALLCTIIAVLTDFTTENTMQTFMNYIFEYLYILFGPLMILITIAGIINFKSLMWICQNGMFDENFEHSIEDVNFADIFLLIGCLVTGVIVCFTKAIETVIQYAQHSLENEHSLFYRQLVKGLKYRTR